MDILKKNVIFVLLLSVILLCFTSCSASYRTSSSKFTDYEGIYITVDEIKSDGLGEILTVTWHNETDYTAIFGLDYNIEFYENDAWKSIQVVDFAIPEIACILDPGSTQTRNYSTKYFNTLVPGEYRIRVGFYLDNEPEFTSGTGYAAFSKTYK